MPRKSGLKKTGFFLLFFFFFFSSSSSISLYHIALYYIGGLDHRMHSPRLTHKCAGIPPLFSASHFNLNIKSLVVSQIQMLSILNSGIVPIHRQLHGHSNLHGMKRANFTNTILQPSFHLMADTAVTTTLCTAVLKGTTTFVTFFCQRGE